MNRLRGLVVGAGLALGMSAASVLALPPVLDRVPADAAFIVTAPSLDRLDKGLSTISTSLQLPMPVPGIRQMLQMGGIEKGVDGARPLVIFLTGPKAGQSPEEWRESHDKPPMVLLVPTSDYAALVSNFAGAQPGAGVTEVDIQGEPGYIKRVGDDYAALGPIREVVEAFTPAKGASAEHQRSMGQAVSDIVDKSDVTFVANMAVLRPILGPQVDQAFEEMAGQMAMMGGGGNIEGMQTFVKSFLDESRVAAMGVRVDGAGLMMDMGASFTEGSGFAKTFSTAGDASALLGKLPNQPYLFAFAVDLSSAGLKDFARRMAGSQPGMEEMRGLITTQIDAVDGQAVSVGSAPGAMFGGGLLLNTVAYIKTRNPAEYLEKTKTLMAQMSGKEMEGMTFTTEYQPGATTVNGVEADAWSMTVQPDEEGEGAAAAQQMMMMMYGGAGGPSGYIAKAEGGVVQTFSKNSVLLGAALDAAKGNNTLAGDAPRAQVAERLAPGRILEAYVGMRTVAEMVLPMVGMMVPGVGDIKVPENLPPIGMGLGAQGGSARASVFVPMPVMKLMSDIAKAAQQADDEMEEEDEEADENLQNEKTTGQPRF
ncbi:MAG TPA: hypothetical protein VD963_05355 [Phycisphaerales bacterium]|nr:hypothetical protein [Phycisphaerales bacterium]